MRQVRFNISSLEKSSNKMIVTIPGGDVKIGVIPDDLNKEDYQVLATYTPTDNPVILNAEYRFIQSYRCPQCDKLMTDSNIFCSRKCYNIWVSLGKT